jgi:hypothetical protein
MLKQEECHRVLKPFIAAYRGKDEKAKEHAAQIHHNNEGLDSARKIVKRVVERVKRI